MPEMHMCDFSKKWVPEEEIQNSSDSSMLTAYFWQQKTIIFSGDGDGRGGYSCADVTLLSQWRHQPPIPGLYDGAGGGLQRLHLPGLAAIRHLLHHRHHLLKLRKRHGLQLGVHQLVVDLHLEGAWGQVGRPWDQNTLAFRDPCKTLH